MQHNAIWMRIRRGKSILIFRTFPIESSFHTESSMQTEMVAFESKSSIFSTTKNNDLMWNKHI